MITKDDLKNSQNIVEINRQCCALYYPESQYEVEEYLLDPDEILEEEDLSCIVAEITVEYDGEPIYFNAVFSVMEYEIYYEVSNQSQWEYLTNINHTEEENYIHEELMKNLIDSTYSDMDYVEDGLFTDWYEELRKMIVEKAVEYEIIDGEYVTGGSNILLYGVPGVGKSHTIAKDYCNNPKYMQRVVFHPDYTYSDFVGQILPKIKGNGLAYEFVPGPFTNILRKAYNDPENMYYLVIEELNRGNAPAIFGEIFQLLDRKDEDDYRDSEVGESEYGITNYDIAKAVYNDAEHQVRIPANLTIIATMNTADQNVFTLDTAFQRRWNMIHIDNDVDKALHANMEIEGTGVTWGSFAAVINDMILEIAVDIASSADKRLGAYFVKESELAKDKFPEKVLKYLWDDAFRMDHDMIFKDDLNSLESVICRYNDCSDKKLEAVLRAEVYSKMFMSDKKSNNEAV